MCKLQIQVGQTTFNPCIFTLLVLPLLLVRGVSAATVSFEATGSVVSIYAGIDPLWDPSDGVPYPTADPEFVQRFSAGQHVVAHYTFESGAIDWYDQQILPTPKIGIYSAIQVGQVSIDGSNYALEQGDISVELDHLATHEDIYGVNARGYQVSTLPIPSSGVAFDFVVAKPTLFPNDSLPTQPPVAWSRSNGRITFHSGVAGLLYEVRFSVESIQVVPEPGALALAVALIGISLPINRARRRGIRSRH